MVDWFNYDGAGDTCYLIYNKDWGTVYYPNSAYGANAAICDHHFTYGYFMFGAAVLATYDRQFYNDYKEMVEILVRDYADPKEPEDDGNMFCKFRAFDQYQGHSWAGGYADSDSGNNQESASEALFSWVGMYLWGEATQNKTYIDAGAYGFTTEMEAVEQYWFDYDETNWLPEYPFEAAGQIYGASMGYGTYFGGQPTYVYGIQWLPISEYLTNYGMNNEKCAKIYQGLEDDTAYAIEIEKRLGNITEDDEYVTPDNGWQHITWPFLSQSDPQRAYDKFKANVTKVQTEDRANTLWFIAAMDQLGHRTNDYVVTGKIQGSVYVKEETGKYTAQVWNPTEETQTVTIIDKNGTSVGTAKVGSKALVSFEITKDNFELSQTGTPKFKAVSLAGGTVTENVTGEAEFTDTQIVEMSCEQSDATIYYTTDGTVPTTDSQVYTGRFLVSSDTTVKAIAVKDGYIDSAYAAAKFVINGDKVESSDNLALGREVTASSENGAETADKAVDGLANTRWQSQSADDEYIQVDLGAVYAVNTVNINWEAAYAEKYQIQVSVDGVEWTTVAEENGLVGKITSSFAATKARYVRMQGIARGTQYGYSIYEFEVYGALQAQAPTIQPASGIYEGSQQITMSTAVKGAEIKYTLDGSIPTEDSATYTEPFDISKSAIVRAVTYRKGMILSDITESSIIIAGTITLNKTETKVAIGRTVQLAAMTDQSVTWSSDNTESAKVDENGIVEGVAIGEAVITATAENGESASCKVTVTEPIHITSIELSKTELEMRNKSSETLELIIKPADTTDDTTVVWKSSDENVVSVNEAGTLTAKGEGEAVVTAIAGKFSATCKVVVGPVATLEEMVANDTFNLALNKKVSVMPSMPECGGDLKEGLVTDGNLNGGHVATTFGTEGTYIEIDLGDTYDASGIDKVLTKYKEENDGDTPVKGYLIQYSINGVDYTTVKEVNGEEAKAEWIENDLMDIQNVHGEGAVRYVRIFYPDAYNWGIQVREIAVLSTEQNAEKVEIEMCEKPADLILSSDNLCEITYTIVPGENQENYLYRVYLDGNKIEEDVSAGTHIATDVTKGVHTVTVISTYNGNVSEGITKEIYVDDGSLYEYIDTDRNIAKGCNVTVDSIYEKEGSQDAATLVDGIVSGTVGAVVETEWGAQDAEIVLDLGKYYSKEMVEEVILAFKGQDTFCDSYTIEFSAYGSDFEKVFETEGRNFEKFFEDKPDITNYSQRLVRYIKINLSGNVYTYGYQMYEVAVIGTEDAAPEEIKTVISSDIAVTGYQISTAMNGELGKTGIRTVYQKEPLVEEQKVKEFGLVYGFADGTITEEDILIGSNSDKVVSYAATDAGKCKVPMGESKTAEYYVRTMDIAGGYTQNYYVRAYAVLEDDTIAYGTVAKYNVYDVAEKLYSGKQMPTGTAHEALYDIIISSVNPDYPKTDYNWNNTLVKRKEYADGTELKIEGYQMTSTLGGVEDTMGLRVVYSIENTLKDKCNQIGLIYGLVYNNQITERDMSLDSTSDFVKSYPATGNGLTDVKFGTSDTAEYYVRTMDVSNMISAGYTVTYLVRAYAVKNDGTVIYSDVQSYSINDIASELYNNDLMGTYNGHQALYNNILTKVNKDYEEVDYNWQNTILKNK